MGCLKGDSEVKKKGARYACGKCGAAVNKKSHVCAPVKLEESNLPEKKEKKKKQKKKKK